MFRLRGSAREPTKILDGQQSVVAWGLCDRGLRLVRTERRSFVTVSEKFRLRAYPESVVERFGGQVLQIRPRAPRTGATVLVGLGVRILLSWWVKISTWNNAVAPIETVSYLPLPPTQLWLEMDSAYLHLTMHPSYQGPYSSHDAMGVCEVR
jgi:hypothetical protein